MTALDTHYFEIFRISWLKSESASMGGFLPAKCEAEWPVIIAAWHPDAEKYCASWNRQTATFLLGRLGIPTFQLGFIGYINRNHYECITMNNVFNIITYNVSYL
jgi:hypothetical protein